MPPLPRDTTEPILEHPPLGHPSPDFPTAPNKDAYSRIICHRIEGETRKPTQTTSRAGHLISQIRPRSWSEAGPHGAQGTLKGFQGLCKKISAHRRHAFAASLFLTACMDNFQTALAEDKVVSLPADPSAVDRSLSRSRLSHLHSRSPIPLRARSPKGEWVEKGMSTPT